VGPTGTGLVCGPMQFVAAGDEVYLPFYADYDDLDQVPATQAQKCPPGTVIKGTA